MATDKEGFFIFTGKEHLTRPTTKINVMNRIEAWLKENGFRLGAYPTFETTAHLPNGIAIAPEYTEFNGGCTTFVVTPSHIFKCANYKPDGNWMILNKWTYKNKEALKKFLDKETKTNLGGW